MRVCIPTTDQSGLDARLSPHFGKSPFFTLLDVELARVVAVPNPRSTQAGSRCDAALVLEGRGVDAVVCRGMGASARETLRDLGLRVLDTEAWTVAEVMRALRAEPVRSEP